MPKKHIVQKGEGISSLSFIYGLKPETIWEHPENVNLQGIRDDANILREGDVVVIPDPRPGEYRGSTGIRHRFRRLGVPAKFRLQLLTGNEVRAGIPYRLEVGNEILEGATDDSGILDVFVPNNAVNGKLFLIYKDYEEQLDIMFGLLDPMDQFNGAQQRLNNLGFDCGAVDGRPGPKTEEALKRFQRAVKLKPTGELDQETEKELLRIHDTNARFPEADVSSQLR